MTSLSTTVQVSSGLLVIGALACGKTTEPTDTHSRDQVVHRPAYSVSPRSATLDLGEVFQFNSLVTVADSSVPVQPLSWSAAGGEITPAGWYRAPRVPGTYLIAARQPDGTEDTAYIDVVEPVAPYFSDDFEHCALGASAQGFKWNSSQGGVSEQPEVTGAIAHSGFCSLQFSFSPGDSTDDAWSEQRFALGKKLSELYIQWYQYWPSGKEEPSVGPRFNHRRVRGPNNNKFLRLWDDDYRSYRVKLGFSTLPGKAGDSDLITEFGNNLRGVGPATGARGLSMVNDFTRGRWLKVTIHVRLATAANNDGLMEVWIDGLPATSSAGLAIYPEQGLGNFLSNGYLMGWANSGFDNDSRTYIDDIVISGVPIP